MQIGLPMLNGTKFNILIDEVIQTGMKRVVPGMGMPRKPTGGPSDPMNLDADDGDEEALPRGKLVIDFTVLYPKNLTNHQRQQIRTALEGTQYG